MTDTMTIPISHFWIGNTRIFLCIPVRFGVELIPVAYKVALHKADPLSSAALHENAVHLPQSVAKHHVQLRPIVPLERTPFLVCGTPLLEEISADKSEPTKIVNWNDNSVVTDLFVPIHAICGFIDGPKQNIGRALLDRIATLPVCAAPLYTEPRRLLVRVFTEPMAVKHLRGHYIDYPSATANQSLSAIQTRTVSIEDSSTADEITHRQHTPTSLWMVTLATARFLTASTGGISPFSCAWVEMAHRQAQTHLDILCKTRNEIVQQTIGNVKTAVHSVITQATTLTSLSHRLMHVRVRVLELMDYAWQVATVQAGYDYAITVPDGSTQLPVIKALMRSTTAFERRSSLAFLSLAVPSIDESSTFNDLIAVIVDTAGSSFTVNTLTSVLSAYQSWHTSLGLARDKREFRKNHYTKPPSGVAVATQPALLPAASFATSSSYYSILPLFQRYNENIACNLSAAAQYWSALKQYTSWCGYTGNISVDTVLTIQCCSDVQSQISVLLTAADCARSFHMRYYEALTAARGTLQTTMRDAWSSSLFLRRSKARGILPLSRQFLLNCEQRTIDMMVFLATMLMDYVAFSFMCVVPDGPNTKACHAIIQSQMRAVQGFAAVHLSSGLLPCDIMSDAYNILLKVC